MAQARRDEAVMSCSTCWLATVFFLNMLAAPVSADELLPTGTFRGGYISNNPVQATSDPATGELRGPAPDLTRELARQLGVPFKLSGVNRGPGVIESVKNGEADIGFVAY